MYIKFKEELFILKYLNSFIVKKHNLLLYVGLILSIIYILMFVRISTIDFDENFTLSLVKHNWSQIIHLTSLDVHPPLYYIVLKSFLSMFTFWTSSALIKIFMARVLSIIISIISFVFLLKIMNIFKIKHNDFVSWILFIMLPTLLGYNYQFQQMTNIRMYALAALFIVIEFYYLLKFRNEKNNVYLLISILFASFASYTQYYSAIIAGLLILLYFLKYVLNKDIRNSIKLFFAGILIMILYIPWIKIVLKQINNSNTYWITNSFLIKEIIVYGACVVLFLYPIVIYCRKFHNSLFNEQMLLILITLISVFIFSMIYGIIKHPIFIFRYTYPILLIYEFLGINITFNLIKNNNQFKIQNYYYFLVLLLLLLNAIISFVYQIPKYNIPSINATNNYISWNKNKNKKIYIKESDVPNNLNYIKPNFGNLIYADNKNRFFVYNEFAKNIYASNNIAYRETFDNINNKINIIKSYK